MKGWKDVMFGGFVLLVPVVASLVVTLAVLALARAGKHYDVPNERSSHAVPTPKSGGVGIVFGFMIVECLSHAMERFGPYDESWDRWQGLAVGALLACGIGLLDDVRGLSPRIKLGLFLIPAALAAVPARAIVVHGVPYVGEIDLGRLSWPLTLFWLMCYPQAFNFMDGLNGIAGLTAIVSAAGFALAAFGDHGDVWFASAALALATIGFLPCNFPKARIFMGDAGSLPVGLVLASLALQSDASGTMPFPASVLLLGPFLFDVAFTLARRASQGKRLGEAHKEHLYQRLSRVWNSHAKVSLLYAGFAVVTGSLALIYRDLDDLGRLLSLALPCAAMLVFAALVLAAERRKGP
jgi:UDP-N-acetylmuramyl pentapeptide phosphotransferase/UDP-N-acetylglucosamine-1-phosphate transferase